MIRVKGSILGPPFPRLSLRHGGTPPAHGDLFVLTFKNPSRTDRLTLNLDLPTLIWSPYGSSVCHDNLPHFPRSPLCLRTCSSKMYFGGLSVRLVSLSLRSLSGVTGWSSTLKRLRTKGKKRRRRKCKILSKETKMKEEWDQ